MTLVVDKRGGAVGWRFTQFYPERTLAVAVFNTPYSPPNKVYVPLEKIVEVLPNFRYQMRLSAPDCDQELDADPEAFFKRILRLHTEAAGPLYDAKLDSVIRGRPPLERSKAITENQLKYYVEQYKRNGFHGALNWYRTTKVRYEESKGNSSYSVTASLETTCAFTILKHFSIHFFPDLDPIIKHPAMMVTASDDKALPPSMAEGMPKFIPNLEMQHIEDAGHWVLWEKPSECNRLLDAFLSKVYGNSKL
jgi:soluble epoxide hydrolase/lipid-phosphate phosphatase